MCLLLGLFFGLDMCITDGFCVASLYAIHAAYAAAVIYPVIFRVDTGGFAIAGTQSAVDTFLGVDDRFQPCKT